MRLTVKYFAWLRERVGRAEETIDAPATVATVADLVAHLRRLGEEYEHAFAEAAIVRAAVDKRHASPDTPLGNAREVAFFPPMTGG